MTADKKTNNTVATLKSKSKLNEMTVCLFLAAGHVTDCPGYSSIVVNDRLESEELGRFDVLVTCPPSSSAANATSSSSAPNRRTFNVTLTLPPFAAFARERVLEVVLDDAATRRRVFLTEFDVVGGRGGEEKTTSKTDDDDGSEMAAVRAASASDRAENEYPTSQEQR